MGCCENKYTNKERCNIFNIEKSKDQNIDTIYELDKNNLETIDSSKNNNKDCSETAITLSNSKNLKIKDLLETEKTQYKYDSNNLQQNYNKYVNNIYTNTKDNVNKYYKNYIPLKKINNIQSSYINSLKDKNIAITNEIIKKSKLLRLEVIESNCLDVGKILNINASGLIGSNQNRNDGMTYFGYNNNNNNNNNSKIKSEVNNTNSNELKHSTIHNNMLSNTILKENNDFNFPNKKNSEYEKIFMIKYNIKDKQYYVKDLKASGLFIKINKNIKKEITNNFVFSFANTHILAKIKNISSTLSNTFDTDNVHQNKIIKDSTYNTILILKVIYGDNKDKEYKYNSSCIKEQIVKLGRKCLNNDASMIEFENNNISRLQCSIYFDRGRWYLCDSDGNKESSNGTWWLASDFELIENNIIIRARSTSFKCNLI